MNRILLSILALGLGAATATAEIPTGYYDSLNGLSGDALREAAGALATGHTRITYNTKTWGAFENTDVRTVAGRRAWWDMYSNNLVYLPDHDALNIEHSVANSWWGGKSGNADAYADLFHLNPSDQNVNNKKSSYPPGTVADPTLLDTDVFKIGKAAPGQGGDAKNVFEPCDQYKGDFARAFFYIFTTYATADWQEEYQFIFDENDKLRPWATALLLEWNRIDPVDSKEIERNEAVAALQKNRNPYIDYPELAEYIWGEKSSEAFHLADHSPAAACDRPEAPLFSGCRLVGVNTYTRRWWEGFDLPIEYSDGTLMLSIDGRDFFEPSDLHIDSAMADGEMHTYRAYTVKEVNGRQMKSHVAALSIIACDPHIKNYSSARWERVNTGDAITTDDLYVILSSNTLHAMSTTGGSASNAFMESAGFVDFADNIITEIPSGSAIVSFEAEDNSGSLRLIISDIHNEYVGSWDATDKNKMRINTGTYTPGIASISAEGNFIFTFSQYGSLQFNKSQPRFLNYETKQTPVYLYRFKDFNDGTSVIENIRDHTPSWAVGVSGREIIAPEGSIIMDLNGRRIGEGNIQPGIYIVTGGGHSEKIMIK